MKGFEPLLDDARLERLQDLVQLAHPDLPESTFLAWIDEISAPRPRAMFGIASPNPKFYLGVRGPDIVSQAATDLAYWRQREKDAKHYAGVKDPAWSVFEILAQQHIPKMANLKDLM